MSAKTKGHTLRNVDPRAAADCVPPEYLVAWEWFESNGGKRIARLPFGKGRPEGMPMPLARQAAIHCPNYKALPSGGAGKKRYALSVYSVGQTVYNDGDKLVKADGTWMLNYHEQRGKDPNQDYNELLFRCMADGVPVGVMVKSARGGYDVLGLAVIEDYDPLARTFLLHGPFSMRGQHRVDIAGDSVVTVGQGAGSAGVVSGRIEDRGFDPRISVDGYEQFRSLVYDAYEGACAVTQVDIPEILDAALIGEYRGQGSLVATNGLLLRADVCRLYDANLICVVPGKHVLETSGRLAGTGYARLDGCEVRRPRSSALMPSEALLEQRYRRYCLAEGK